MPGPNSDPDPVVEEHPAEAPAEAPEEAAEGLAAQEDHYTMRGDPETLHTDADPHRHDGADWNTPTV